MKSDKQPPRSPHPVLIMFGGVSAEHEVSVITGLQVVEHMDRARYAPVAVYATKDGSMYYLQDLKDRHGFLSAPRRTVAFGHDADGGFIEIAGGALRPARRIYPRAAYLAFHGGKGESGPAQGLLDSVGIPFTSCGPESSAVTMNKRITRQVAETAGVPVVPGVAVFAAEVRRDVAAAAAKITHSVPLPVIVKPVHLGSSIGLSIARTDIELQKCLLEAAFTDNEILVEKLMTLAAEYNCAVRAVRGDGIIETSEVERPVSKDEILSFADKYQRGAKKTGPGVTGDTGGAAGMASLDRELPAKIGPELRDEIQSLAKKIFTACACKGMVRIDFMYTTDHKIYLTEVNPIPGSMAFYLWEASGIPFTQQITDLVEASVHDAATTDARQLDYKTDIIERFTGIQPGKKVLQ